MSKGLWNFSYRFCSIIQFSLKYIVSKKKKEINESNVVCCFFSPPVHSTVMEYCVRAKKVLKIATKQTLYASKWMNDAENVCLCITRNIYKNGSLFIAGLASIFRQYLEKWCNIHECELREGLLKICYNKQFLCIEHSKFMCWPSLWLICMVSILHSKINVNLMFLTRKKHWNLPFEKKRNVSTTYFE